MAKWKKERHRMWEQFRDDGTTAALVELLYEAACSTKELGLAATIKEFFTLAGHGDYYDSSLIQEGSSRSDVAITLFRVGRVCGEIVDHAVPAEVGVDLQLQAGPYLSEMILCREHEAMGGSLWSLLICQGYTTESLAEDTDISWITIEKWIMTGQGVGEEDFMILTSQLGMSDKALQQRQELTRSLYRTGESILHDRLWQPRIRSTRPI